MKGLFKALVLVSLALAILLTMASCENIVNKIPFLGGTDANEQTTNAPEEPTTPVETPEQTTPQEHTHIIVIDEAVAPTCTKAGLTEGQHCSECKEVLVAQKEIPALGHKYDAVVTDPTCTENGYTTYTCHCGDTYVADEVPALGHKSIPATCTSPETCEVCGIELSPAINHSYTAVVTAPTCTADGYTTYTCSCGDTYTEAIPASGHKYETVVTAPTCTEDGYTTYTCHCGHSYVADTVKAPGHTYNSVVTEPTCVVDGYTTYTCQCGHSYTEAIPALGHDEVAHDAKAATCTEAGHNAYVTCSRCDYTTFEEIKALGHDEVAHDAKDATCTEAGHNAYVTCTRCDYTTFEEIKALGHDEVAHDAKAPPCTEAGNEAYVTCSRCDYTTFKAVDTLGHDEVAHDAKAPTCTEAGNEAYVTCSRCDYTTFEEIKALGHDEVAHDAKAPTCTEKGNEAYVTCSRCDYTTFKEIDVLDHTEVAIPAKKATCTETGLTAGVKCSVCGEVLIAPTTTNALGHDEVAHDAKDATCTEAGHNAYVTCTRCDYTTFEEIKALGHDEVAHDAKAPPCTEAGNEAYVTCSRCDYTTFKAVDTLGHDEVAHDAKAPTCTEAGNEAYVTCSRCDYTTFEEIKALGHNEIAHDAKAPTCTDKGNKAYVTCSRCDYTTFEEIAATGHTETKIPGKPATCTATGLTDGVKCSVCNAELKEQEEIPARGHDERTLAAEAATCTKEGLTEGKYCFECGETLVKQTTVPKLPHTYDDDTDLVCNVCSAERACLHAETIIVPGKSATCTEPGLKDGKKCKICGDTVVAQETIPATGHQNQVKIPAVMPDCTTDGATEGLKCYTCGTVIVKPSVIPAKGHTEKVLAAVAATCTKTGLTEGKQCSVCNEILVPQETVPMQDHTYSETWTKDGNTHWHACTRCGAKADESVHAYTTEISRVEATCEKDGKYTLKCDCGATKDVVISATGHTESTWIIDTEATCTTNGSKHIECTVCKKVLKTETIEKLGHDEVAHDAKDATCTDKGYKAYVTCTRCDYTTFEETAALGHDEVAHDAKAPTCTEKGNEAYVTCTRCDYTTFKAIDVLDHTEEAIPAKKATCTETGLTSGIKCSVCGEVLIAPTTTDALGHDEVAHDAKDATCTEAGHNAYVTCSRCDYTTFVEIPALGHDEVAHDAKDATCTEKGNEAYVTCTRCDYTTFKAVDALGHDEVAHDAKEATCTEAGHNAYKTCTRCDYTTFEETDALGHDYKAVVTAPTCTEKGYTTHTCANCGDSYKDTDVDALGHIDEDGNYLCDNHCTTVMPPEADSVLTIPQANALGMAHAEKTYTTGKYYVTGVIVSIENTTYGNIYIEDAEGNRFYLYGLYVNGTRYDAMEDQPHIGQTITVYGIIGTYTGTDPQMKNAELIPCEHSFEETDRQEATCDKAGFITNVCSLCNKVVTETIEAPGHNYEFGTCTECEEAFKVGETSAQISFADIANRTEYSTSIQVWQQNGIIVTNNKGGSTTNIGDYSKPARFYKGSEVIIEFRGMTAIKIDATGMDSKYVTPWLDSLKNIEGVTAENVSNVIVITFATPTDSIKITTTAQIRANSITVIAGTKCEHNEVTINGKDATCTETGLTAGSRCSICGEWFTEQKEVAALGHTFGEWIIDQPATEEAEGKKHRVCEVCGDVEEDVIPKLSHVHSYTTSVTAPTCTEDGYTTYTCACGDSKVDDKVDALGHTEAVDEAVAATCTTDGKTEGKHCSVCNTVLVPQEVIPAGHNYEFGTCTKCGDKVVFGETTADLSFANVANRTEFNSNVQVWEQNGITVTNNKASSSNAVADYTNPARFYQGSNLIVAAPGAISKIVFDCNSSSYATALKTSIGTVAGVTVTVSSDKVTVVFAEAVDSFTIAKFSGQVRMDSISVTYGQACDHNEVTIEGKDATCTETGLTEGSRCLTCGEWFEEQEEIAALGHTYGDWILDKEATEEEEGLQHKACEACGDIVEDIIPTLSHEHSYTTNVTAPTCTAQGYTTYTCACGDTYDADFVDMIAHTYSSAVTAPTCTADGYTTYTCDECGDTYKDNTVPALGHTDADGNYKCEVCGKVAAPAADEYLTLAEANKLGVAHANDTYTSNKYYVSGVITQVANTTYGNVYIQDANGNTLLVYGLYSFDGATRYDALEYKPNVGDEISVWGVIGAFSGSAQMKSGWLDEVVICEHNEYVVDETKSVAATCTKAGLKVEVCTSCNVKTIETEIKALGHTTEEGTCERCGEEIGGEAPALVEVTGTLSFANKAQRTTFTTSKQVWAQNGITLTNDKASSTSSVADYAGPARFYKSSKITVVAGGAITKIVFDCNSSSYATALKNSISAASGVTVTVSSDKVTVTFAEAVDSFVITSLTGGQVRMDSITVTYLAEA